MSDFSFRRAMRETTSMLIALAGASGSGKTYTAIVLGLGLAYPNMTPEQILETVKDEGKSRLVVLDSEGGRALHYAPQPGADPDFRSSFPFEYAELLPPFTPASYQDAVVAANDAGFKAVVVDSMSHEWESEGGVLEWAENLEAGVPKPGISDPQPWKRDQWIEQPVKSPGNWKEPKRAHKQMMMRFLQCRLHMIFCLRAEEKMKLVQETFQKSGGGTGTKVKVIPASDRPVDERWEPICEKRFMYEMTASFVLLPSKPGVGISLKLQEQHRHCFPHDQLIGINAGSQLSVWASGGGQPANPKPDPQKSGEDPAAAREQWMVSYIAKVNACEDLEALQELQQEKKNALDQFKNGDRERWDKICDAHASAFERLKG